MGRSRYILPERQYRIPRRLHRKQQWAYGRRPPGPSQRTCLWYFLGNPACAQRLNPSHHYSGAWHPAHSNALAAIEQIPAAVIKLNCFEVESLTAQAGLPRPAHGLLYLVSFFFSSLVMPRASRSTGSFITADKRLTVSFTRATVLYTGSRPRRPARSTTFSTLAALRRGQGRPRRVGQGHHVDRADAAGRNE